MATHIDNSQDMSSTDIKNILINTFKKSAEKSVKDASYDRTILATIQYCTDATIGQYKIKYQNGYFTAYSTDDSVVYANRASVYVLVPGNDMNNRMFITGLANNDNNAKIALTNLEADQEYSASGPNFINSYNDINMQSYWVEHEDKNDDTSAIKYSRTLYDASNQDPNNPNSIQLIDVNEINAAIKNGGGYIKFGASFMTAFKDDQKETAADYGLILKLSFTNVSDNNGCKNYVLSTFDMIGSPFNFSTYMPQAQYWKIDVDNFIRVESIEQYMIGFNPYNESEPQIPADQRATFRDIYIKDLELYSASKLYNITNDLYAVHLDVESFTFSEVRDSIPMTATLTKSGVPVVDPSQNLKYFWGKEDSSIDSVNNPRYNSYLGKGWYCLNTAYKRSYNEQTIQDLKDYTIANDEVIDKTYVIEWKTDSQTVELPKKICTGKVSNIKCIIVYQNVAYESNIQRITNPTGKYLIVHSDSSDLTFKNGQGYMTLTAGLFTDDTNAETPPPQSHTLDSDITYTWTEINSVGVSKTLPDYRPSDILFYYEEWGSENDNETKTEEQVEEYLHTLSSYESAKYCLDRYNYYNDKYRSLCNKEELTHDEEEYKTTAYQRSTSILADIISQIQSYYVKNGSNKEGYYILGPSQVTGKYNDNINNYTSTTIDTIDRYYYGTQNYTDHIGQLNTLYLLKGSNIQNFATYKISAIEHVTEDGYNISRSVGTATITIENKVGSDLTYDLEITNGTQSFLYDEGGLAPNSTKVTSPIFLRPLYFKLYNRDGSVIYDSQLPDDDESQVATFAELNPTWSLYNNGYSLLRTDYPGQTSICSVDPDDGKRIKVLNQASFTYDLEEMFDINKRDSSNIELQITYSGETIVATTHFSFVKQGELGTNGTNGYLKITNPAYESYKDGVLAADLWSKFNEDIGGVTSTEYAGPAQRHLNNAYLYATHCYNSQFQEIFDLNEAPYVNLLFAQGGQTGEQGNELGYDGGIGVYGELSATLIGYWYEDGIATVIDGQSSLWGTEIDHGKYQNTTYYCTPSFRLNNTEGGGDVTGAQVTAYINEVERHPYRSYKPTTIQNYRPSDVSQTEYTRTANNIVRLKASYKDVDEDDVITDTHIIRHCYGYYPMSYYYFARYFKENGSWTNVTPDALDPARHIVVTGGFDEVVYDSAGCNPEYNKQQPFKVHLFNEKNEDITQDLLDSVAEGRSVISWHCSKGFKMGATFGKYTTPPYGGIGPDVPLYGKYCVYEGKYYRCIKDHTKSQTVTLSNGTVVDPSTTLVEPYWIEVNIEGEGIQKCLLKPNSRYESLAASNLFNSWISVYVRYTDKDNADNIYEAEALIPINVICNKYGSAIINNWDGKKTKVEDSYIISNAVVAGIKDETEQFIGVTMGTSVFPENSDRENEVGLMGFGYPNYYKNNQKGSDKTWARTFFMDATTGKLVLGPSGSTQIIMNPYIPPAGVKEESWSRLAGWYFSQNFLYKPVGEGDQPPDDAWQPYDIQPRTSPEGSAGIYAPYYGTVTANDVFLWASARQKDLDLDDMVRQLETYKTQLAAYGVTFNSEGKIQNQRVIDGQFAEQASEYRRYQTFCNEVNLDRIAIDIPYEEQTVAVKDMVTEEEYNTLVAQIEEEQTHYSPPKTVEEAAAIVAQDYFHLMTRVADQQAVFDELCLTYENLYNQYGSLINSQSNGIPVTWKDFNHKNANFYVTYGGYLHASSVDIEGRITATTGSFGKGPNKIDISTTVNGTGYLLYNKNFWVQDSTDPEIFIKGNIRAKSGQFGKVGDNVNPDNSANTVFIQYSWYPWTLPSDSQPWNSETIDVDTSAGKIKTYTLYHKKFYIDKSGEVVLNGRIYSKRGRIGDWVIDSRNLRSWEGSIVLHPKEGGQANSKSYIQVGNVKLRGDGYVGKESEGDNDWWITAEGIAHFNNPANTFQGTKFIVSGTNYGISAEHGLVLSPNQKVKIGNTELRVYSSGEGLELTGRVQFSGETNFSDNLVLHSGAGIFLGGAAGTAPSLTVNGGLAFAGADSATYGPSGLTIGGVSLDKNGLSGADISTCTVGVGGPSLTNYIESEVIRILDYIHPMTGFTPDYAYVDNTQVLRDITGSWWNT